MEKKYSWKFWINADADKVGKEIESLEMLGEVTPEIILKYAQTHKRSELHKCFEWDDGEASRKYRIEQASRVLCSISIDIKEEPKFKQRVYVNVRSSNSGAKTFKNIKNVLEDDNEYKQLLEKARQEFVDCKDKYDTLLNKDDLKDIIFEIYREI